MEKDLKITPGFDLTNYFKEKLISQEHTKMMYHWLQIIVDRYINGQKLCSLDIVVIQDILNDIENDIEKECRVLKLTLTKKWFQMILSGIKKEEYREIKQHWITRLIEKNSTIFKKYDYVEFKNGYTKNAPTMLVECIDITMGKGNPEWGGSDNDVFIIKLGKIIETKNIGAGYSDGF